MKFVFSFLLLLVSVAYAIDGMPSDMPVMEIGWDDLAPGMEFDDPYADLTEDQLYYLGIVARIRGLRDLGKTDFSEEMMKEYIAAVDLLEAEGVDIDWILSLRDEIREKRRRAAYLVNEQLDGMQLKMPGYLLPLDILEGDTSEFLLVPWVGACIHTPPPPPNQIVYVKMDRPVKVRTRFQPVLVEGKLAVENAKVDLFLVDGRADIPVQYTMQGFEVDDYTAP